MITRFKKWGYWLVSSGLILALLLGSLAIPQATEATPPGIPHQFYGMVTVDGSSASQGTAVAVHVSGASAATTTVDSQGRYGYSEVVSVSGSGGAAVTFYVGGTQANETTTLQSGEVTRQNLTVTTGTLAVSTSSATSVATTTATLNGNLTDLGGESSATVSFQYGTTASYGSTASAGTKSATGTFNAAITGLSASTTYHFRAKAVAGSTTVYGSDTTFTTSASGGGGGDPSAAPHQFYGYVYINDTLVSSGTTIAAYVNGESAASTTTDASGRYGYSSVFQVPGSGSTVTFYVDGVLTPQTEPWKSGAITRKNLYATAATLTVSTGSAAWASSTSATLDGTLVSFGDDTSATVSIQYGTTTAYGNSTTAASKSSTGSFSGTATSLAAGTTYHYRAKAVGIPSGDVRYGSDATYAHTATGNLTVTTNSATAGDTIATLNGNLASLGTDTSVVVSFQWGETDSYGSEVTATQSPLASSGAFSYPLTGLTNGTTYHYRAKAVGSPSSTTVYGSDLTFTPNANGPIGDQIIGADDAEVDVSWPADQFRMFRFLALKNGPVDTMKVKPWMNGWIRMAIYDTNEYGEPGELLNQTAAGLGTYVGRGGWRSVDIDSTEIVEGRYYWLAWISTTQTMGLNLELPRVPSRNKLDTKYAGFVFPNPAGTGYIPAPDYATPLIAGY